jgi:hypothetical protein
MIWQYVITGLIVLAAVVYLLRRFLPSKLTGKKDNDCGSGDCGC